MIEPEADIIIKSSTPVPSLPAVPLGTKNLVLLSALRFFSLVISLQLLSTSELKSPLNEEHGLTEAALSPSILSSSPFFHPPFSLPPSTVSAQQEAAFCYQAL